METLRLGSDAPRQSYLSPCSPRPERYPLANPRSSTERTAGSAEEVSEDIQMPQPEEENSSAQAGWAPQLPSGSEPPEEAMRAGKRGSPRSQERAAQWRHKLDQERAAQWRHKLGNFARHRNLSPERSHRYGLSDTWDMHRSWTLSKAAPEEATRAGTSGQPAQWTRTSNDTPSQGEDAQAHHQDLYTSGDSGSPLLPSSRSANKRRCMDILRRLHENDEEVTITSRMDEKVHRLRAAEPRSK